MNANDILDKAARLRGELGEGLHDHVTEAIYADAASIADAVVQREGQDHRPRLDQWLDSTLTHPVYGFVVMGLLLFGVFWLTITGANVPSSLLADLLLGTVYTALHDGASALGLPTWLSGFGIDGVYLSTAWVVSVMLPPMAIFFPLFTLMEDFGYLPRVAFNLDRLFARSGAHGKQSLTMMMGYGCNAAGVIATRIIDSPRERLIAILTNNFSICNGRWPTLILMGTIFIGAAAPSGLASLIAAASVMGVVIIGIFFTLLVSWGLSRTWLKGETSVYSLELPPYRPPRILQTLYTSIIDRTLIVLWRAVVMAAPAGAAIWLASNITLDGTSIAGYMVDNLQPLGVLLGLNGVILAAYVFAIPANELVIPAVLMLTLSLHGQADAGVLLELGDNETHNVLVGLGGWSLLTAVNLMLFSLLHNPCSTTILTIYQETKSRKWTAVATLLPLALGVVVTLAVATLVRVVG